MSILAYPILGLYGLESNGSAMLKKANALFMDFVTVDDEKEEAKVFTRHRKTF
jgi:hypothetical protein